MIPMRLQAASRKEVSRISVGVLIGDVLMVAGLFLLSQLGIGKFELGKILLNMLYPYNELKPETTLIPYD